jgi:hypothetical protein
MGRILATDCLSPDEETDRGLDVDGLDEDENSGLDALPSWEGRREPRVRRLFDPRELQQRGH